LRNNEKLILQLIQRAKIYQDDLGEKKKRARGKFAKMILNRKNSLDDQISRLT
jgi:hypothetical protein